jgi:hypothetical protein
MTGWAAILDAAAAEYQHFRHACAQPRATQLARLRRILGANRDSAFGRAHGFANIDDLDAFRAAVAIRGYDEVRPWVERAAAGEPAVLTADPVVAFEETGGSTSGRKLIPYNAPALRAFRTAVLAWLADLARARPGAVAGRAYAAVSPAGRAPRTTRGGIPIGLASEGAYLGPDLVAAFAAIQAVPPDIGALTDPDAWRFATLLHLLAAEDLSFVSVWSPTFLTSLVDALPALAEPLLKALFDGTRASPGAPAPDPTRARHVERALARRPIDTASLWPKLDTISAWADGPSRIYACRLAEMFPTVHLQPKGLLATEAPVTIPWAGSPYPAPALASCVLEFIADGGDALLSDELRAGDSYRVVITTPGGLYRYDLGDRVRCHDMTGGLARLAFVGRAGIGSDLVGEKLTEDFVADVLGRLDCPACLLPRPLPTPHYRLLVDTRDPARLACACAQAEAGLSANPQYAYARAIGQLGSLTVRAAPGLAERVIAAALARGRRAGDVKPAVLVTDQSLVDQLSKPVDDAGPIRHAPADFLKMPPRLR